MGNCIQTQPTEEEQHLKNIIEYVSNLDISIDPEKDTDKSWYKPEYRKYAMELFRGAIGDLVHYTVDTRKYPGAIVNTRIVVEKALHMVHTYKYFIDTLCYPWKTFFQPMKDVMLKLFLSIEEGYRKPNPYENIRRMVDGVSEIKHAYTECICSTNKLEEQFRNPRLD